MVVDLGWVDFDSKLPPCCPTAQPIQPNSHLPKHNRVMEWPKSKSTKPCSPSFSPTLYKMYAPLSVAGPDTLLVIENLSRPHIVHQPNPPKTKMLTVWYELVNWVRQVLSVLWNLGNDFVFILVLRMALPLVISLLFAFPHRRCSSSPGRRLK